LGFGPLFLQNETPYKIFGKKVSILHLKFWPQEAKKQNKKPKSPYPPHKKFGILDGTKHTHKNFCILYFIIPK
jgi:hypothetical protein